jgi:hypothetical protein
VARGGARSGAGRKAGAVTQRTQRTTEIALKAAGEGATPLEVMLTLMRTHFAMVQKIVAEAKEGEEKSDDAKALKHAMSEAVSCASLAAPYVHPRLASVESTINPTQAFAELWDVVSKGGAK